MTAERTSSLRAAPRDESERLAERLARCLPGATFEMETLVRLAGVEASREVATAAVTCEGRPRLLLNPDFVAEYCASDEHLFLLAMHELWHVILAHTRLYPRATPAENVAFDAVINAGLCRQFSAPEYRGFFERVNSPTEFPALLLRPPEGWPRFPSPALPGPPGTHEIMNRLYPKANNGDVPMPLYSEILALLDVARTEQPANGPVLLGDHSDSDSDQSALDDPLLGDVVRRIVSAWPPPPFPLAGRDAGRDPFDWTGALHPVPDATRRAFARVLRRVLGRWPGAELRRGRAHESVASGLGPLPNAADRLVPARRALGLPTVLQRQSVPVTVRIPETPAQAFVYIDVSGSMFELLPYLAGLLAPYVAARRARVFQFSTEVFPLPLDELRSGKLRTTGGTSIDCVLEHWLAAPHVQRVLVLTDGYVGPPRRDLAQALCERGLKLHAVLPGESAYERDLKPLASTLTVLPPLRGTAHSRRNVT